MTDPPPPFLAHLAAANGGAGHDNPSQPRIVPGTSIPPSSLSSPQGLPYYYLRNSPSTNVPALPPPSPLRRGADPDSYVDGGFAIGWRTSTTPVETLRGHWLDDTYIVGDGGEGYTAAPEIGQWLGGTYIAGGRGGGYTAAPEIGQWLDGTYIAGGRGGGYTAEPARDCGLAEEVIARLLKTTSYEEAAVADGGEPEICAVCLDDLHRKDQTVGVLGCRHRFHGDCIGRWLRRKNVCPLCKGIALQI